ncbi:MAG: VCBS repeat-containing protein [Myxococcota bacterium]
MKKLFARARAQVARATGMGVALCFGVSAALADDDPFFVQDLRLEGRVVQADLADLDGDSRGDLLCVVTSGLPPNERREIHVFFQGDDGSFAAKPDWKGPLPSGAAAYDLANLDDSPATELVLLRRDRLTLFSMPGRSPSFRDLPLGIEPSIAVVVDERGLDRMMLVREGLGDGPRLVAPGMSWTAVLDPGGEVLGLLEVGARANYYLPQRPGPLVSESEVEIYLDHPRLSIGDVNGDGRGDVISANRHELKVFLQNAQGRFPAKPSRSIALGRVTPEDHVRNSGLVRVDGSDLNGDGLVDLLVSTSSGSVFDATTVVGFHLNQGGQWNLDAPDQVFRTVGGMNANMLVDIDGDGAVELMEVRVPTGVLEIVEVLVTRAIDANVTLHRRADSGLFETEPWHSRKLGVAWDFETFRSKGFVPTLSADFNGDGMLDMLNSGDGDQLEVHLGSNTDGYGARHATQTLDTSGRIRFGDLDADGLSDFVLYSPRRPELPVRVGTNRGVLPGTRRETTLEASGG